MAACRGVSEYDSIKAPRNDPDSIKIISKPRPIYPDEARENNVQGTVVLSVVFLRSGNIGDVEPIMTLPDGLTEQAIVAAKRIRFEPQRRNGRPVTTRKKIKYTFTIY
jgi:TonB family protein